MVAVIVPRRLPIFATVFELQHFKDLTLIVYYNERGQRMPTPGTKAQNVGSGFHYSVLIIPISSTDGRCLSSPQAV